MIRRLFCVLTALMLLCGAAFARQPDLIRLHVVAHDDSPAAQALKLEIRDACLESVRSCVADAPDSDTAYMRLNEHIGDFLAACDKRAQELGFGGEITAETGIFPFPDRVYDGVLVPAGDYRALRITIGDGKGKNWWCVLYPGLCMPEGQDDPLGILSWIKRRFGGA